MFKIAWNSGVCLHGPVDEWEVSLEEEGEEIRFLDTLERVVGVIFFLRPFGRSPPSGENPWTSKLMPYNFAANPSRYLRALFIGRAHRVSHITGPMAHT